MRFAYISTGSSHKIISLLSILIEINNFFDDDAQFLECLLALALYGFQTGTP